MKSDSWFIRIWKVVYPILIHAFLSGLAAVIVMIILEVFYTTSGNPLSQENLLIKTVSSSVLIGNGLVIIAGCFIYQNDKKYFLAVHRKTGVIHWILLAAIGLCASYFGNAIIFMLGLPELFSDTYDSLAQMNYSQPLIWQILGLGIAAPIAEELIFRGLIFKRMRTYCKFPVAMLLSAAAFGIYHGNVIQFLYAFMAGLLFAFVYEKFRNIWAPIVLHMGANLASVAVTEFSLIGTFLNNNFIIASAVSAVIIFGGVYLLNTSLQPKEENL